MIDRALKEKKGRLESCLGDLDRLLVCFSGGVDSSLLLAVAADVLGNNVLAVTAESAIHPAKEMRAAMEIARQLGVEHRFIRSREMEDRDFLTNPPDRCYICKNLLFQDVRQLADRLGIAHIAHGANTDDLSDYRPGFRAASEQGVLAPLIDAQLNKQEIRRLSRELDLPNWNKPQMACLATRLPVGVPILLQDLQMIEAAENFLAGLGFSLVRVRSHGKVARIELMADEIPRSADPEIRGAIVEAFLKFGFDRVTLDLEGYRQGSMNPAGDEEEG
jgi:uncharacterized protein